jgi:hypothetical protein
VERAGRARRRPRGDGLEGAGAPHVRRSGASRARGRPGAVRGRSGRGTSRLRAGRCPRPMAVARPLRGFRRCFDKGAGRRRGEADARVAERGPTR